MTPDGVPTRFSTLLVRADEIRAELVVRAHGGSGQGGVEPCLQGTLTGPRRGRDTTLPTRVPLVACNGMGTAARATFTEPAFWTPEMPNLYRLEAQLLHRGQTIAHCDEMIGLRRFGVRGSSFWLDGRRWVPRGVGASADTFDPQLLHELCATAELRVPHATLLAAADEAGVAIVARLEDVAGSPLDRDDAARQIAALSGHPSVVIAIIPRIMPVADAMAVAGAARAVKGTMLVGLEVDGTQPPEAAPEGVSGDVDCIVVDLSDDALPHAAWRQWPMRKPLVARRRLPASVGQSPAPGDGLAWQRRECDRLQATLAAWGLAPGDGRICRDWAGYVVAAW